MIHALPAPLRGNTHARITKWEEAPGSGIVVRFRLGTLDGSAFVADRLIPEIRRQVNQPAAKKVRERAANAGAPVTSGEQEWRKADLLAQLDEDGWTP